jgi:LysM repeat protein
MKRLVFPAIGLLVLFACGKKEEPAPETTPAPEAQPAPQTEPSSTVSPPRATGEPSGEDKAKLPAGKYVVARGDTLYSIAKRHGLNYHDLAKWNGIEDPHRLLAGQELRLTPPGS